MTNSNNNIVPSWVEPKLFENILRESLPNFQEINGFKAFGALAPGENYSTIMLRVQLEAKLKDNSIAGQSFMLKVQLNNRHMQAEWDAWDTFGSEALMYHQIVPELEKLYHNVNVAVTFGAKAYQLPKTLNEKYILLEDLSQRGFKPLPRQLGLDMEHCKSVLKKIAQWHAGSAIFIEPQNTQLMQGILCEKPKELFKILFDGSLKNALESIKQVPGHEQYYGKLEQLSDNFYETICKVCQPNEMEFNVLNHGDLWSNNIMFQHDADGKLQQTYFVDLQAPFYGTPAADLYYFIFSSAKLELKVDRFNEMIKYYHDNLCENLLLLKYEKPLPTLRDLHCMLIKYGIWALLTSCSIMSGVLCKPTEIASIDNLVGETQDSDNFKNQLYMNDVYIEHLQVVLPWLYLRGAFDY